jgi:hypothetical protein
MMEPQGAIRGDRIITRDGRRRHSGRQDHPDILTALATRIVAQVVAELAPYLAAEDKLWYLEPEPTSKEYCRKGRTNEPPFINNRDAVERADNCRAHRWEEAH